VLPCYLLADHLTPWHATTTTDTDYGITDWITRTAVASRTSKARPFLPESRSVAAGKLLDCFIGLPGTTLPASLLPSILAQFHPLPDSISSQLINYFKARSTAALCIFIASSKKIATFLSQVEVSQPVRVTRIYCASLVQLLMLWRVIEKRSLPSSYEMAAMASSARDIPKACGRDSFAAVAARSVPAPRAHPLPTPPNSISPSLPPHGLKPYGTRSATAQLALDHVESDLDLHDGSDAGSQGAITEKEHDIGSPGYDAAGNITPNLLAKHHLPEILLAHGPLAIRYIMGYLTTSVPGFSGIPPAKARRLVVGALEGRGSGGEMGGINGDVKFEKVGWGRWNARLKGHPTRANADPRHSPPPSIPSSFVIGMPIEKSGGSGNSRNRLNAPGSSWAGDSAVFSLDDDTDMMFENEADKMSLDGDASCSSSEAPPEDEIMADDPNDITDDEDWKTVGAAALRAASYSASGPGRSLITSHVYNGRSYSGGGPSLSALAKSVPSRTAQQPNNFDLSAFGTSDSQEREAIEALLRLGSV